jgi:hypothetical protein
MSEPARSWRSEALEHNTRSVRHGVWSARRADAITAQVEELAEMLATQFHWTAPYQAERLAYARAVLDEEAIRAYLDRVGMLDERGNERPAVRTLERFAGRAAKCRHALGLSPMAAAKLLSLLSDVVRAHPDRLPEHLDGGLDALVQLGRDALGRGEAS